MTTPSARVVDALRRARTDLDTALADMEHVAALDPSQVSFAAHALGNFLMVVTATSDMLLEALADHPDQDVRTWLEGLQHAAGLMSHIVGQLGNVSAIAPEAQLRPEEVDLIVACGRACEFYRRIAERKEIDIIYEPTIAKALVRTDRVAAAAVLDNLLSNAVKYSPGGRRIWVRVSAEGPDVICSVRDEGPGLSADERAQLFKPGVRLSSVPTAGEPSSGYGLAVARSLASRLGGDIWCESEPGKGAVFSFKLPAVLAPGNEPFDLRKTKPPSPPGTNAGHAHCQE
jgi:signal transduction histidine kinase